ncbi:hypothetical protein F5Y01DRAFT_156804 [Xylaria sp. FL0043]|nr:hypothetical protein F5Y01DRAFT_156804 [Xylaria sp. FL0043]
MSEHQTTLMERRIAQSDDVRTLTIKRPESTFVQTLTLGNGVASSTVAPVAAESGSKSSNRNSSYVGAILSGVVVVVVFLFILWLFCRKGRSRSRRSRNSSRRSRSPASKGSSSSSSSSDSSRGPSDDGGTGSVVSDYLGSEVGEEQFEHPQQPMPAMPPQGGWAGPPAGYDIPPPGAVMGAPGAGMAPPGVGMGIPFGRGGPPPIMGRGGGPFPDYGGPPPGTHIVGSGGPPPMPQ